jgi:putative peptidoglycan lipid II flippase
MGAAVIAAGILLSRLLGLVREALKAAYLGASGSIAADAFNAAFRIPNLLQVLFGEGALSASFIPVYANLLARGEKEKAQRVAGAVLGLLALLTSVIVLLGVLFTPTIIVLIAPGFTGERRDLTVLLTRILFPGSGLFVMAAWCLGVLNSHRKFFLSYAAPVAWNIAMITALLLARHEPSLNRIAIDLAWGSVVGAGLQFLVQLPTALKLVSHLRVSLDRTSEHVRSVIRNFAPVFVSRGVVQISAYVDQFIASFLPIGSVSLLFYAQTISMLPVSLFGISIAAAELPEMASILGAQGDVANDLRERLNGGLRRVAFLVIPSAVAFLMLGDALSAALYQRGRFHASDSLYLWSILAGSAVGLLASTMGRLYSSAYYALQDTRTPLRFALVRVSVTVVLGYFFALPLPRLLGVSALWGIAGLTASAGIAGWIEFLLLRSRLNARIGDTGLPAQHAIKLWGSAVLAGFAGVLTQYALRQQLPLLSGAVIVAVFGVVYFITTHLAGVPEAAAFLWRVRGSRA